MQAVGLDIADVIEEIDRGRQGGEGGEGHQGVNSDAALAQDARRRGGDHDEAILYPLARANRREKSPKALAERHANTLVPMGYELCITRDTLEI